MPIRIYSKDAKELILSEEKQCAKLISTGAIYSLYVDCCAPDIKIKNRLFLAKDETKCVGWGLICKHNKKFQFMVYIKRLYRRRGLATKIYKKAKQFFKLKDKDITVFVTDNSNRSFFEKVRKL